MNCPSCTHESSKVVDSRVADGGTSIRRRRECEACEFRFTTFERLQTSTLIVEKKDGTTEPYDREKLEKSIVIACGKRKISLSEIREKLSELEEKWVKEKVIESQNIGEDIMEMLKNIDEVAYIRFASVYRQFKDMQTFREEFESFLRNTT